MCSDLTQDRLRELLDYDCVSGDFRWLVDRGNLVKKGSLAGCADPRGYRHIKIDGVLYLAHRLAWFFIYGTWPRNQIDHINQRPDDNRISNLRDVTNTENAHNQKPRNTKLPTGVTRNGKGFEARICVNNNKVHLGTYPSEKEAGSAYLWAKKLMHNVPPSWFERWAYSIEENGVIPEESYY